jgi:hypothetical protein
MQQVRRDTIKTVRHSKVNVDTMSWEAANADTSFAQANRESFEAVMAQPKAKPKIVLTAFDTIQPCDVSLLAAPTYYTAKPQPVRNTQDLICSRSTAAILSLATYWTLRPMIPIGMSC